MRVMQLLWALLLLLLLVLPGCERREGEEITLPPEGEGDAIGDVDPQSLRIVSLAPALTRMLVDLGLDKQLVAVAENDAAAPQGLPVVGNFLEINSEALIRAQPTHVLTMYAKHGTPGNLEDLAEARRFKLVSYPMPQTIDEVGRILFDEQEIMTDGQSAKPDAPPSLASLFDVQRRASELKYLMLMKLGSIESLIGLRDRPRVLMVLGTQPLMASGPNTVHDRLLRFAGGVNAAEGATVNAPIFDREALVATVRPDVILLLLPQAPPLRDMEQDDRLAVLRNLDVPAVANQRIVLLNDPLILLPSTTLAQITAAMAKAIHPDLAAQIDEVMASDATKLLGPQAPPLTPPIDLTSVPAPLPDAPAENSSSE